MDELAAVLHRERQLLEKLLFRLRIAGRVVADDDPRFLADAAADLERAAEALRDVELRRTRLLGSEHLDNPDLRALVERTHEPLATMMAEHREALAGLVAEVGSARTETWALAEAGLTRLAHSGGDALDREIVAAAHLAIRASTGLVPLPALAAFVA